MIPITLVLNRYTAGAAFAVAVGVAGYNYRSHLIGLGYKKAQTELQVAQSERQREQIREASRLQGLVQGKQIEYNTSTKDAEALRARLRTADSRLRQQEADFSARLATASAASFRKYAQASEDNLDRAREDIERYGFEAANCSAAAHALVPIK